MVKALSRVVLAVDRWQRRHRFAAVGYAVIRKFSDDQANLLVVALGWYGFTAIYPLLLVVVTILGFIGAGGLGTGIVSTLHQFPVIGADFNPSSGGSNLHGSVVGLVIGVAGLLYGAQGVTQTAQQAMAQVWNVPRVRLPGFLSRLGRSLLGLTIIGGAFVVNAFLGSVAAGYGLTVLGRLALVTGLILVNVGCFLAAFLTLTPPKVAKPRQLVPGAILGAVGFTLLTTVGTGLVQHQLRHTQATYGAFASIIGVVAYLLLLAKVTVYAAELNPVLASGLWPRALPNAPPTDGDQRVLQLLAHQEQRRPDERIGVGSEPDASTGAAQEVSAAQDGGVAHDAGGARSGRPNRPSAGNGGRDPTDWSQQPDPGVAARRRRY